MGWETNCKAEVVFNKETYDSIYQVQSKQEEADKLMSHMRDELLIMAASDPKLLILKDCEGEELDITQSIRHKIDEILEMYDEAMIDKIKLDYLEEFWHTRDGDFVKHDMYAKYTRDSHFGLKSGRIYGVNKHEKWNGVVEYVVINDDFNAIHVSEEEFKDMFEESNYDEWNNQPGDWQ